MEHIQNQQSLHLDDVNLNLALPCPPPIRIDKILQTTVKDECFDVRRMYKALVHCIKHSFMILLHLLILNFGNLGRNLVLHLRCTCLIGAWFAMLYLQWTIQRRTESQLKLNVYFVEKKINVRQHEHSISRCVEFEQMHG